MPKTQSAQHARFASLKGSSERVTGQSATGPTNPAGIDRRRRECAVFESASTQKRSRRRLPRRRLPFVSIGCTTSSQPVRVSPQRHAEPALWIVTLETFTKLDLAPSMRLLDHVMLAPENNVTSVGYERNYSMRLGAVLPQWIAAKWPPAFRTHRGAPDSLAPSSVPR